MRITFYGVRGSTPVSSLQTVKYGGNTSCVHIELESGHDLILDAGTGIRSLGKKLAAKSTPVNILISHGLGTGRNPDRKRKVSKISSHTNTQHLRCRGHGTASEQTYPGWAYPYRG